MTPEEMAALAGTVPSPFGATALRDGFEDPADVPEIHGDERERLRALIAEVRRGGTRIQVVTGDPGDGKTHLLARLRAESERSWFLPGSEFALVPVDPLREVAAPHAHLLRALVSGLSRPFSYRPPPDVAAPRTPLEFLLWRALFRAARALRDEGLSPELLAALGDLDLTRRPGQLVLALSEMWPQLEPLLVSEAPRLAAFAPPRVDAGVFRLICRFPRPQTSHLVVRWLGAHSLAEDELAAIGAPDPIEGEDLASRVLLTLLHVSDAPLVLGLDQLEGIRRLGDDAAPALFGALVDLYSAGEGARLGMLVFCQAQIWQQLAGQLEQQVLDRLVKPNLHLGALRPEQGERLVARRLDAMWKGLGVTPPHPTFPYAKGFVRRAIESNGLRQPRRVLDYFARIGFTARLVEAPPAPPPRKTGRDAARNEYRKLVTEESRIERSPEQRSTLAQSALGNVLQSAAGRALGEVNVVAAGTHTVGRGRKPGVRAKLSRGGQEVVVYAEASNAANGNSAAATARRLQGALKEAGRALWLREEQLPLPKAAGEIMKTLASKAAIVRLSKEDAVAFAAVEGLLDAAAAGNTDASEGEARDAVVEIAPEIEALRRFFASAFGASPAESGDDAEKAVVAELAKPPHVAAEARLSRHGGIAPERVAEATTALERGGKVLVLKDREGARVVLRRPE